MLSTVDDCLLTPELPNDISLQLLQQSDEKASEGEEASSDNDAESAPLKGSDEENDEITKTQSLMDDFGSICLLVFLYTLQVIAILFIRTILEV